MFMGIYLMFGCAEIVVSLDYCSATWSSLFKTCWSSSSVLIPGMMNFSGCVFDGYISGVTPGIASRLIPVIVFVEAYAKEGGDIKLIVFCGSICKGGMGLKDQTFQ